MNPALDIVLSFAAMLGYGLSIAVAKYPVQQLGGTRMIALRNAIISILLSLGVVGFFISQFNLPAAGLALAVGLFGYLPLLVFYKALKVGQLGIIMPIASISSVWTILLAVMLGRDSLTLGQGLIIFSILGGVVILSYKPKLSDDKDKVVVQGTIYAVLASLLWGVTYYLFSVVTDLNGPYISAWGIETGVLLAALGHLMWYKLYQPLPTMLAVPKWHIILAAVGTLIGTVCFNVAISLSSVSLASVITFAYPLVGVVYGRIVYREVLSPLKILAIIITVASLVVLSLF